MFNTSNGFEVNGSNTSGLLFPARYSLKTIDQTVAINLGKLVAGNSLESDLTDEKVEINTLFHENEEFLAEINNLLTEEECEKIIEEVKTVGRAKKRIFPDFGNVKNEEIGASIKIAEADNEMLEYEKQSMNQLRKIAKKNKIPTIGCNKEQLIEKIQQFESENISQVGEKRGREYVFGKEEGGIMQDLDQVYDEDQRTGKRLVGLDKQLADIIWKRVKNKLKEKIKKEKIEVAPRGFYILPKSDWKIKGMNECVRVIAYAENDKFLPHKDAQYCPSPDVRSIFTLIVYLNDLEGYSMNQNVTGGETVFYFPKIEGESEEGRMQEIDMTVKEEIQSRGGLEHGYSKITVKPKTGRAVIASHSILHESRPLKFGAPNFNNKSSQAVEEAQEVDLTDVRKWILKFDVYSVRKGSRECIHCHKAKSPDLATDMEGKNACYCFAKYDFLSGASEIEKSCFLQSLCYFREAQFSELYSRDKVYSNELYEKALSIRYHFPAYLAHFRNQRSTAEAKASESVVKSIPMEIWSVVFSYLGEHTMYQLTAAYPEQFMLLRGEWMRKRKSQRGIENIQPCNSKQKPEILPKFIPDITSHSSIFTRLVFESEFFTRNKEGCCRVAAMYAFALLSGDGILNSLPSRNAAPRTSASKVLYPVRYDASTGTVSCVPMVDLLSDVFHGRQSYGSIYVVSRDAKEKMDPKKDWANSVDRSFIFYRHANQFSGIDLHAKLQSNFYHPRGDQKDEEDIVFEDEWEEEEDEGEEEDEEHEYAGEWQENPSNKSWSQLYAGFKQYGKLSEKFPCYLRDLYYLSNAPNFKHSAFRTGIVTGINGTAGGRCEHEESFESFSQLFEETMNNLVFDFENNTMVVEELSSTTECCLFNEHLKRFKVPFPVLQHLSSSNYSRRFNGAVHLLYKVNIKPLIENNGFNHASVCHCAPPYFEWDAPIYRSSTMVDHLHIYVKIEKKKARLLLIYGGILAL